MDSTCDMLGTARNAYKILVGKPEWKQPLRRSRHRWKDGIKINLQELECEVKNSALVNMFPDYKLFVKMSNSSMVTCMSCNIVILLIT
jgi:uncharacterized Zn-finger protein